MHHWICKCGIKEVTQTASVGTHFMCDGIIERIVGPPICRNCSNEQKRPKFMMPISEGEAS